MSTARWCIPLALLAAAAPVAARQGAGAELRPAPEEPPPETMGADQAREVYERVLGYLLESQHEDGSWDVGAPDSLQELGFAIETYYAWHLAAHALATRALLLAPETPDVRAALERAIDYLVTARVSHRGADWDVDSTWASLCGFDTCVAILLDPRFADEAGPNAELAERIARRGRTFLADLLYVQTPDGGWAYYDDPPFTAKPTWATSFCTASVLPALVAAKERLGWQVPQKAIDAARRYVADCELPNGAFAYDHRPIPRRFTGESIDQVKGSLGRIQVCNWALRSVGFERTTLDRIREGLDAFFRYHQFLDYARLRPIPHEGYYANAGYFYFFGHYYAARAIELLPAEEREAWHRRLRVHLAKTITPGGHTTDFLPSGYMVTASTSYAAMALSLGLREADEPR